MIIRNPATYHHRFTPPGMPHWTDHAACHEQPTDIWFPQPADREGEDAAVAVCCQCPVKADCLAEAMESETYRPTSDRHGIWGGKTPQQRCAIYRKEGRHNGRTSA